MSTKNENDANTASPQPAAQGELPPMALTIADEPGSGHYYTAQQMREWGASQRRAGQLDMIETITTWGEGQRQAGERSADAKLVAENRTLVEKLQGKPDWKRHRMASVPFDREPGMRLVGFVIPNEGADMPSVQLEKILATPAPTAGEASAEKGGAA